MIPPPLPRFHLPYLLPLLSAACLTLLVVLLCLPPLHSSARAVLRPRVTASARKGLRAVAALQEPRRRLASRPATLFFAAVSSTVSVSFYVAVLPAIIWLVDFESGVRLVLALAVSLYVGNALKDLVCAPRPLAMSREGEEEEEQEGRKKARNGNGGGLKKTRRTKAKIRLLTADSSGASERKSLLEYGFPSSHVMNSLVLSLHAVQCCRGRFPGAFSAAGDGGRLPSSVAAARCVAVLWTSLVALARVACGMHTPVDVCGGLLAGFLVVAALALEDLEGSSSSSSSSSSSRRLSSLDARYVSWLASRGPRAAAMHTLATALLLRLHPLPLKYTTSFEATTAFAGACAGVALGVSLGGGGGGAYPLSPSPSSSSLALLFFALRRVAAGLAAVATVKEVSKRVVLAVVPLPYRACPLRLRRLWQPPVRSLSRDERMERLGIPVDADGRPWDEVLTAKFFSYAALGWAVAGLAPLGFAAAWI